MVASQLVSSSTLTPLHSTTGGILSFTKILLQIVLLHVSFPLLPVMVKQTSHEPQGKLTTGFCMVEVAGVPPSNVHNQEGVNGIVERSKNDTTPQSISNSKSAKHVSTAQSSCSCHVIKVLDSGVGCGTSQNVNG